MEARSQRNVFITGVVAVIALIAVFGTLGWEKVEGNEAVVRQHWQQGVLLGDQEGDVWRDGTHFYLPRFFWDTYKYDIGRQKLTMDFQTAEQAAPWNLPMNEDAEYPRLQFAAGGDGGQQVWLGGSVVYKIGHELRNGVPFFSPTHLVELHKSGNGRNYESVILKRIWIETVQSVVNDEQDPKEALDIYSGAGFEQFRKEIDLRLKVHPVLADVGIVVESTIMYPVRLEPRYEKEITEKQLATQTKLKEMELALAADETAKKITSLKQADVNEATQIAQAKKVTAMKRAEAEKYAKEQDAEAERYRQEQEAVGVLAMATATAEGKRLETLAMYGGVAGSRRFEVEQASAQAKVLMGMLSGVQVIPENALIQLVTDPAVGTPRVNYDMDTN